MEEKLISLEIKVAHQEAQIEELNQVLYEQHKKLQELDEIVMGLAKRLREAMAGGPEIGPANEKPPHY